MRKENMETGSEAKTTMEMIWSVAPSASNLPTSADNEDPKLDEIGQNGSLFHEKTNETVEHRQEEQERTRIKKRLLVEAYQQTYGSISRACRMADISRSTYYEWVQNDPVFKKEIESSSQMIMDDVEGQLLRLIQKGHPPSIRYWLDRRHPKFKPHSKTEIETSSQENKITFVDMSDNGKGSETEIL
jgi:hypothetical protein